MSAFLSLLQTVFIGIKKYFIEFVGVKFDLDCAVCSGSRFAFQNKKTDSCFSLLVDMLIVQSVNIVFIVWGHYLWFENDCKVKNVITLSP